MIESTNPRWHDLATDWEDVFNPVNRTPTTTGQILRGLKATQDEVNN